MKAIRQRCPLCGRLEPAPKKVKVAPVDYASMIFREPFQAMHNPSFKTIRFIIKPSRFDHEGRAIDFARVGHRTGEFDNSWATMCYGRSPYDRPESEIGKLGTLESYQRELAGQVEDEAEELEAVAA